jgi:DNA end-binding protein Ku
MPEGKVADKPYALLHRAMVESKRHALAQVVISGRQHVALLRPRGPVLMLMLLAYEQELKDAGEFERGAPDVDVSAAELKMAKLLTEAMSVNEADLSEYRDTYTDEVRALIVAKAKGKQTFTAASPPDMSDRVINLMDALEKSLQHAKAEKLVKRRRVS